MAFILSFLNKPRRYYATDDFVSMLIGVDKAKKLFASTPVCFEAEIVIRSEKICPNARFYFCNRLSAFKAGAKMPPTTFVLRASAFIIPFSSSNVHPMRFLSSPAQNVSLKKIFLLHLFNAPAVLPFPFQRFFLTRRAATPLAQKRSFAVSGAPFSRGKSLSFAPLCRLLSPRASRRIHAPLFSKEFALLSSERRSSVHAPFPSCAAKIRRFAERRRSPAPSQKKKERLQSVPFHVLYISRDNEFLLL